MLLLPLPLLVLFTNSVYNVGIVNNTEPEIEVGEAAVFHTLFYDVISDNKSLEKALKTSLSEVDRE